jgi:hypothetical protein
MNQWSLKNLLNLSEKGKFTEAADQFFGQLINRE